MLLSRRVRQDGQKADGSTSLAPVGCVVMSSGARGRGRRVVSRTGADAASSGLRTHCACRRAGSSGAPGARPPGGCTRRGPRQSCRLRLTRRGAAARSGVSVERRAEVERRGKGRTASRRRTAGRGRSCAGGVRRAVQPRPLGRLRRGRRRRCRGRQRTGDLDGGGCISANSSGLEASGEGERERGGHAPPLRFCAADEARCSIALPSGPSPSSRAFPFSRRRSSAAAGSAASSGASSSASSAVSSSASSAASSSGEDSPLEEPESRGDGDRVGPLSSALGAAREVVRVAGLAADVARKARLALEDATACGWRSASPVRAEQRPVRPAGNLGRTRSLRERRLGQRT